MRELVRIGVGVGLLLMGGGGCGGAPARGGGGGAAGSARFVIVQGTTARFMEATPAGVKETRRVTLPAPIRALEWIGAEPVVMLEGEEADPTGAAVGGAHHGEVGRITDKGYEPFPALPAATWKIDPPPEGLERFDTPTWRLVVSSDGAIWQARCEWGYFGDGDECTEYVYARRWPAPGTTTREEPKLGLPWYLLPEIPPSQRTQVEIVDLEREPEGESGPPRPPIKIVRCTEGGKTIEYPPEDERYEGVADQISWLSTEPAIYSVDVWRSGETDYLETVYFEGCAASKRYASAEVAPGPDGWFVLVGETSSVRWRGREVGTIDGGGHVRFAPPPPKR